MSFGFSSPPPQRAFPRAVPSATPGKPLGPVNVWASFAEGGGSGAPALSRAEARELSERADRLEREVRGLPAGCRSS